MANMLPGMKVVVVPPPSPVARTWRERLFSRPWRPLEATRVVEHPMWGLMSQSTHDEHVCFQRGDTLYVTEAAFTALKQHESIFHA